MIEHQDFLFPGTHASPVFMAPELQTVRTKFFGVKGESEITGESGARAISIHIRVHGQFTQSQSLMAILDSFDKQVGRHGTLRILSGQGTIWAGGVPREYPNTTFEGFTKDGGDDSGPLPDNVGLLDGTTPSWWVDGTLVFHQLLTGV